MQGSPGAIDVVFVNCVATVIDNIGAQRWKCANNAISVGATEILVDG